MVVRMPLGARPRAIQTPEYPAPEPISTAAWAPTQLAAKRRNAPDSADTGGMPPPAARSRAWRRTSSSTAVSSARYAAMASAWMATATPLTLATLRSGRFQPNPQRRPAVRRRPRLGAACRGSVPASIGWAQRPSGGRTRELAWTRRPTPPPGQDVSNQTDQNQPNRPDRTRRRTPVRRNPAPRFRRPASSRPTGPPRPPRQPRRPRTPDSLGPRSLRQAPTAW